MIVIRMILRIIRATTICLANNQNQWMKDGTMMVMFFLLKVVNIYINFYIACYR